MLRSVELEYQLPAELIATQPASPRDSARLMVAERGEPTRVRDYRVCDLPDVLRTGDVLVFNTTRVVPARFFGRRRDSGGRVEGLYLFEAEAPADGRRWCVLLRGRHLRATAEIDLFDGGGRESGFTLEITGRHEPGAWMVEVRGPTGRTPEILERVGRTPVPPYIVKARQHSGLSPDEGVDRERYQTVYATEPGSVAAPTAGLHFTPELLDGLSARGFGRVDVVLHVGAGTFKPVETEFVENHPMHAEWCTMSPAAVRSILDAREKGRRIIAVGTTAARTLESFAAVIGEGAPETIETRLLITPGYRFRWVDGLLTNFHLPRSTLMAMVAALLPEPGVEHLKHLYARAIAERYRFYSYGDAMLIV